MSSMLEQAIVDADALREAALKNAEDMIVEKYSNQIKEAVEALLEQPELPPEVGGGEDPDDLGLEDPELGMDVPEEEDPALKDMPVVTVDGEKLCPCPEEEDEYIVDFTELTKKKDEEGLTEPAETQEDLVADILGPEEAEEEPLGLQEEIDLDENLLSSILEELVVDLDPALDGYGNNGVPNSHLQHAQEQLLARAEDTEVKEENEALKKALKKLKVENRSLQSLGQESKKMKDIIYLMRDRLNEASLSNAKLLYTNKVLISDSLNGRQKNKIVEAISGAETVEEAKVIYETLQNAVGSTTIKKEPQSLSEAVKNSSAGLLLHGRSQKATKKDDSSLARWKILAGLK